MNRFQPASLLVAGALAVSAATPVFAQFTTRLQSPNQGNAPVVTVAPPVGQNPVVVYQNPDDVPNAENVREQLRRILSAYPPSLRQVLALDPALIQREDYLAPYPGLSAFLQQHPEVARNPSYYFGSFNNFDRGYTEADRRVEVLRNTLEGLTFLTGFLTVISLLYALLRQALEYRRWRRQIQIQTDIHTKLLDRMTNNQELLAYIETSAGRRFLEAPVPLMAQPPASSIAPVARILWSVQIGVVVVAAGIGFWIARTTVNDPDLISVFQVMGSLAMSVGVGFVVSALMSWALSQRMGLLAAPPAKAE